MEFDPKWVHMARYELILKLDGAIWLRIIFKPILTSKRAITIQNDPKINPEILSIYGTSPQRWIAARAAYSWLVWHGL